MGTARTGPLAGLKVIELVGLGPGPFAGMLLADMGADVLRIDRVEAGQAVDRSQPASSAMNRGKWSLAVDLKQPKGVATLLRLVDRADALFEVFRPGVAERLGFGPDVCMARNPRLIYGRLTGWGQEGPYAHVAGHDIDYLALAGALEPLGRAGQPPTPPINVLADFAGGGMLLAFGVACAAFERAASGRGQVVDAAMVDGAALMLTPFYAARASGFWGPRGTNFLDTGAPFYDAYETADGEWVAVGAIEPQFYAELRSRLGLADDGDLDAQWDKEQWPVQKERLAALFRTKTRNEWCELLEHTDACFAPVLAPTEAPDHPHNRARHTFLRIDDVPQPAPAPRFSRTPATIGRPPTHSGDDDDEVLAAWGFTPAEIDELRAADTIV
ncbi:MAG: CoA transferase [Actinobacteria bacterium]|nr:MAG: CoA transferase [Actinomycetota bacterium]